MVSVYSPIKFAHGLEIANRFMLAPLTNQQSHTDGTLSDEEHHWLTMRAKGGFGITMTCASHVQRIGQGFPGQLGCFSDDHLEGLSRLAADIKAAKSVALVQLHHAGNRSPKELIGEAPVCPSDDEATGARALTTSEVEAVIADFVSAAVRSQRAGFDGVELHGAHGYLICQFLSSELNQRTDQYGGSLENRARVLMSIVDGVRESCGPDFILAVRLSPERFGMRTAEIQQLFGWLVTSNKVDLIDMSLWDVLAIVQTRTLRARSCWINLSH
jgi:2,4-dienoyl-CoA reductase-like NADH-dependent reductase (Old Yellow Enzyme family)